MKPAGALALIINTYNQPEYLGRVLAALARQTREPDEVLLADDGSGDETRAVFERWAGAQAFRTAITSGRRTKAFAVPAFSTRPSPGRRAIIWSFSMATRYRIPVPG